MTHQPSLFEDVLPMPTLPGMVSGIVRERKGPKRTIYTLQCAVCLALEEPEILVLMKTKFITCGSIPKYQRMCRECRHKHYRECDELRCKEALRDES